MFKSLGIFTSLLILSLGTVQAKTQCATQTKIQCDVNNPDCDIFFIDQPNIPRTLECGTTLVDLTYRVKSNVSTNSIDISSEIESLVGDTSPLSMVDIVGGTCSQPIPPNGMCTILVDIKTAACTNPDNFPQQISQELVVTPDTLQEEPLTSCIEIEVTNHEPPPPPPVEHDCAAVGFFHHHGYEPLSYTAEDFGNHWAYSHKPPHPEGHFKDILKSVSCEQSGHCSSVGSYISHHGKQVPLSYISSDFGNNWFLSRRLPHPKGIDSELNSVSCIVGGDCSAVGYYKKDGFYTLPLFYLSSNHGDTWKTSTKLSNGHLGLGEKLNSVSCASDGDCTAVGHYYSFGIYKTPVSYVSFDKGNIWTLSPKLPHMHGYDDTLTGVSCDQNNHCTAVGYYRSNTWGGIAPLTYRSTDAGNTWALSTILPKRQGEHDELTAVSCASSGTAGTHCVAVGFYKYHGRTRPASYTSNDFGKTWKISREQPRPQGLNDRLTGVSCVIGGHCTAIGNYVRHGRKIPSSYVSHDYGKTWKISATQPPALNHKDELKSVSCAIPSI